MEFKIRRVSNGPKHHLFGFHDLVQSNAKGDYALSLELDDVSRPPQPRESCLAGVLDLNQINSHARLNNFIPLHTTHTWNYPQGARQQWLGDTDLCFCNDRLDDGALISILSDVRAGKVIDKLPFPVHCINEALKKAIYVNYDRLFAVGGYGYTPFNGRNVKLDDCPEDDGLWMGDLKTGERTLIASLYQIALCDEPHPVHTGYPHYVTHPMLNPKGTRIAMLHQYRVQDGGDISRMIVCDLDGGNMRCLVKGLVSHYTWIDDMRIFAWGGDERSICRFRESPLLLVPGFPILAKTAKEVVRMVRNHKSSAKKRELTKNLMQTRSFMLVTDDESNTIRKSGLGILTEDGHPMACPGNERLVVCDTYPNKEGDRQLFFYDTRSEEKQMVDLFRRIFETPDLKKFDWKLSQRGTDPRIVRAFDREHYMFARSGLHCDLHPRWSYDGETVFFDSIHEGTRQIYAVDYTCR